MLLTVEATMSQSAWFHFHAFRSPTAGWRRLMMLALASTLFLGTLAKAGAAELVEDLFEAEVPVAGRDEDSRQAAIGQALLLVAVKVSGRREAASQGPVTAASAKPDQYLQQYRFRTVEVSDSNPAGLTLLARFDPPLMESDRKSVV